jgi:hypothetical protein
MKREILLAHGWRKITSVAHANVLLRREIKRMNARQQRYGQQLVCFEWLLWIKPGVWFKFARGQHGAVLCLTESSDE